MKYNYDRNDLDELRAEIERLEAIVDANAKTADLLDRTLTALEKELKTPLDPTREAAEATV